MVCGGGGGRVKYDDDVYAGCLETSKGRLTRALTTCGGVEPKKEGGGQKRRQGDKIHYAGWRRGEGMKTCRIPRAIKLKSILLLYVGTLYTVIV